MTKPSSTTGDWSGCVPTRCDLRKNGSCSVSGLIFQPEASERLDEFDMDAPVTS